MKRNKYNVSGNKGRKSLHSEERNLYDLVVSGEVEKIKSLREKKGGKHFSLRMDKKTLSDDSLRNAVYCLIFNCAMMVDRCIVAGMPREDAYALSDIFIKRADHCKTVSEVRAVNDEIAIEFAERMKRILNTSFSPTVQKAASYICDNLNTKLTVNKISEITGYDRSYISEMFRQETGYSISEFILKKRIDAAKGMIEDGMPLYDIAHTLCFSSQSHFCDRFRTVTGMTPGEYRRNIISK